MSKPAQTAQEYWDVRSELFAKYYKRPSLFDRIFRKAVYVRTAVALQTIAAYDRARVLDVGSGPGVNSVTWLKNTNASSLTGIDFAPSMVEFARKNAEAEGVADRCRFIVGDFMEYDFGVDRFDVSVAAGVFDYVADAVALLKRMVRLTDGAVVASWPAAGIRMSLRRYRYTCPLFDYSEKSIRELHREAGVQDLNFVETRGGWVSVARPSRRA